MRSRKYGVMRVRNACSDKRCMYGEINRNGWAILDTLSYYDYKIDNCIDHLYKIHETKGEFLACCTVD